MYVYHISTTSYVEIEKLYSIYLDIFFLYLYLYLYVRFGVSDLPSKEIWWLYTLWDNISGLKWVVVNLNVKATPNRLRWEISRM